MLQSTLLNSASRPDPTRQSHALWLPRHTHPSTHYLPGRWTTAHSTNPTAPRTERRSHFLTHHAEAVQQEEQARCDARLSRNEGRHVSRGQHDESEEHRRGERHEVPHVGGQPVGLEAHAGYHLWADTEPYHKRGRGGTKTSSIAQRDLRVTHSAVSRYLTVLKLVHSSHADNADTVRQLPHAQGDDGMPTTSVRRMGERGHRESRARSPLGSAWCIPIPSSGRTYSTASKYPVTPSVDGALRASVCTTDHETTRVREESGKWLSYVPPRPGTRRNPGRPHSVDSCGGVHLLVLALGLLLANDERYPRGGHEAEGDEHEERDVESVQPRADAGLVRGSCFPAPPAPT